MMRLWEKYRRLQVTIKASLWFMICSLIQKGISFFTVPIYTKILTTSEYGVYSVYLSWESIVYILATLNLNAGVFNNGMIKYEDKRDVFTSATQGLSTILCIIVAAILLFFSDIVEKFSRLSPYIIMLMMIHVFFSASYNYWITKKKFEFQYRGIVVATLVVALGTPVLAIMLMSTMDVKSDGIILGTVIAQSAVGLVLYILNYIKGKKFFDREIWKYCLSFNLPLIPHYLSYVVLGQSDRIMIDNICGSSDAGIYSLAYQLSIVINLVTNAIDGSFNPWTYQKLKSKDYQSIRSVSTYLILLFSIGVIGLTLIAPEILLIIAPIEYQAAKWVIPPVVAGCFFLFVAGTFMRVEFYHERNKIIMVASTVTAIVNIVLNALFIPIFGFIAAAYTTLFSYMLFALFHYLVMLDTCKKQGYKSFPYDGKMIGLITVITTALAVAFMILYPYPLIRFLIVALIIIGVAINKDKVIILFKEIKSR